MRRIVLLFIGFLMGFVLSQLLNKMRRIVLLFIGFLMGFVLSQLLIKYLINL